MISEPKTWVTPVQCGLAAEHLVCADFLLRGMLASIQLHPSAPYDILVDAGGGRAFRVQVKATASSEQSRKRGDGRVRSGYRFRLVRDSGRTYSEGDADIFAYVVFGERAIIYESAESSIGRGQRFFYKSTFQTRAEGSLDRVLGELLF